ncbi:hypothetical protein OH686_16960 [Pseudomonas sp. SO81]|nr:hypothetical protein OH686_16960 [Pseudomonas sp. SO81]
MDDHKCPECSLVLPKDVYECPHCAKVGRIYLGLFAFSTVLFFVICLGLLYIF